MRCWKTHYIGRSFFVWGMIALPILSACGEADKTQDTSIDTDEDTETLGENDTIQDSESSDEDSEDFDTDISDTDDTADAQEEECEPVIYDPNPFITEVIEVEFGEGAGFGQDQFPTIIYGPPLGGGENSGSLDVVSLGRDGYIIVGFDQLITDGNGPDIIVFENVFIGWYETGIVSASMDGDTWFTWDCSPEDSDNEYPGCAGASPSLSHPDNCIDARDPSIAGGDAFDLADLGLSEARYIRVTDSGFSGPGGFDLDAIAIVNGTSE